MHRDLKYGPKLTKLMEDYQEDGLAFIVDNYTIEDIGNMVLEEQDAETCVFLAKLIIYLEPADGLRTALDELNEQWVGDDDEGWPEDGDENGDDGPGRSFTNGFEEDSRPICDPAEDIEVDQPNSPFQKPQFQNSLAYDGDERNGFPDEDYFDEDEDDRDADVGEDDDD